MRLSAQITKDVCSMEVYYYYYYYYKISALWKCIITTIIIITKMLLYVTLCYLMSLYITIN